MTNIQDDFKIISQTNKGYCHLQFRGPFLQKLVKWDAHLSTLSYYISNKQKQGKTVSACRQFIEISKPCDALYPLQVGLNIQEINHASIMKFIIMIRQYKNLAYGRYEYGPEHHFN